MLIISFSNDFFKFLIIPVWIGREISIEEWRDVSVNSVSLGKFDWGIRYVIIFLYVQIWIRLGTVS